MAAFCFTCTASPFSEIALVLVRFDHFPCVIVNAVIRSYDGTGNVIEISARLLEPVRRPRTSRSSAQAREHILPFCLPSDHRDSGRDGKAGACRFASSASGTTLLSELWPQPM